VAFDSKLAERLLEDFENDLAQSKQISYREWRHRSIFERMHEYMGWVLERQQ
jgi:hypothetical protein